MEEKWKDMLCFEHTDLLLLLALAGVHYSQAHLEEEVGGGWRGRRRRGEKEEEEDEEEAGHQVVAELVEGL